MLQVHQAPPIQIDPIPNFCKGQALLPLAVAMELLAICVLLASSQATFRFDTLVLLSLYLQWIGLCCAATLCALRSLRHRLPVGALFAVCWAALVLVVTLVAGAAWQIDQRYQLGLLPASEGFGVFVLRQTALSAIVAVLLLRYFWARQEWREKVRTDAESRLQALTARIRPHFLFNALNSVAALVSLRPEQAEQMVEDLGEVFRACLDQPKASLPLREEIDICKAYLRIEQSRLGDKLKVEWRIPPELMDWQIPRFVLQPLVENAVYHGVSRIKEGGDVLVTGELIEDRLHLQVSNPLPSTDVPRTEGHRIAANNIASRLAMMYGTRGRLEMGIVANRYTSRLLLPREPAARHGGKRK